MNKINQSSNHAFYRNTVEHFGRRFKVNPKYRIYGQSVNAFVNAFQLASVIRYHSETEYLGTSYLDGVNPFKEEWYATEVSKIMSCAWFLQLNGFEYFLEMVQPGHVSLSNATNSEIYTLLGPEWSLSFTPNSLNLTVADLRLWPRFMNRTCVVNDFVFDGKLESFECDMLLFGLVKNDLIEVSIS